MCGRIRCAETQPVINNRIFAIGAENPVPLSHSSIVCRDEHRTAGPTDTELLSSESSMCERPRLSDEMKSVYCVHPGHPAGQSGWKPGSSAVSMNDVRTPPFYHGSDIES